MDIHDNIKNLIDTTVKTIDEYGFDFIDDKYIEDYL